MTTLTMVGAAEPPARRPGDPVPKEPGLNVTDRDRLRAAGTAIRLVDGRELTLRFSLDELCRLEEEFGSLVAFTDAINGTKTGGNGPFLTVLRRILAIGLARHGITNEHLGDLFDITQRWAYRGAIIDAYNEAMPPADGTGKASAETSSSRGETSTTQAPSDSADPNEPSGE